MVRDTEERELLAHCKKQVQFDLPAYLSPVSRDADNRRFSNLSVRRRSSLPIPIPDGASTATARQDGVEDPGVQTLPSAEDFEKYCQDTIVSAGYKETLESLNGEDLQKRIDAHHDTYLRERKEPGFPFRPVTSVGQDKWPTKSGITTLAEFRKMCSEPEALFHEFRSLSFYALARTDQVEDIHSITRAMDTILTDSLSWGKTYCFKAYELNQILRDKEQTAAVDNGTGGAPEDLQTRTDAAIANSLRDRIGEMEREVADIRAERDNFKDQNDVLSQEVTDKNQELIEVQGDLNAANADVVALHRRTRADTPVTTVTEGGTRSKKSRKLDVDEFYGEPSKDKVPFEVWYNQIKDMIRDNADHFTTPEQVFSQVKGRIKGAAAQELIPFLREGHPMVVNTTEGLLEYMHNRHFDHNAREKAKQEYDELHMTSLAHYQKFLSDFVRLAGEKALPPSEWKEAFKDKLMQRVVVATMQQYFDDTMDFQAYTRYCKQVVQTFMSGDEKSRKSREVAAPKSSGTTNRAGSDKSSTPSYSASGSGGRTFAPRLLSRKPSVSSLKVDVSTATKPDIDRATDTGAAGYLFISVKFAARAVKYLNTPIITDFCPHAIGGFEGRASQVIDAAVVATFRIHGRATMKIPILVIDMKYDLIIGRKWFEEHDVILRPATRRLDYPDDWPPTTSTDISLDEAGKLLKNPDYQMDAESRNAALDRQIAADKQARDGRLSQLRSRERARATLSPQQEMVQARIRELESPAIGSRPPEQPKNADWKPTTILQRDTPHGSGELAKMNRNLRDCLRQEPRHCDHPRMPRVGTVNGPL
ncbi:hypothetical protein PG999_002889 [Apiospora kogelbergensis]|uniref:Uncharacterized protein n=1 Tax=Apiospora kogelbergensis TaxID=1337665 RepID=A0AAW0R9F0_9PEZI